MDIVDYDDVQFRVTSDGVLQKMTITKQNGFVDVLIPHILPNGKEITTLGAYFCKGCDGVYRTVKIDDGIKCVSKEAFSCSNIKKVVWTQGCPYIPEDCFRSSTISEISNIEHVVSIGNSAFAFTYYLSEFEWPVPCGDIPSNCFVGSALEKISNTDNVKSIGAAAFSNSELTSFTVPRKVKTIGDYAFSQSKLEFVSLHDDITQIGCCAFEHTKIERIYWPKSCVEVPEGCFNNCVALTKIGLPDTVVSILPRAFAGTSIDEFRWPDACREIPDDCFAFSALAKITNISHISSIGKSAFADIHTLSEIDLSTAAIEYIAFNAFYNTRAKVFYPYYFAN